jgi:hypothetical protein
MARRSVLWTLGQLGHDPETLREAEAFAVRWLHQPSSVPSDVAIVAVPLASLSAGPSRLKELREAARAARSPQDRILALRSMGSFDNPDALRQALDVTLTDELKISELRYVFGPAIGRREARETLYQWDRQHWSDLRARLPGALGRGPMVDIVGSLCSQPALDDARAFFAAKADEVPGTKRPFDEAVDGAALCVALHDHGAALVTSWLSAHPAAAPAR